MTTHSPQRVQFESEGYLVVRGLIGDDDLRELDQMVDRLIDGELKPVVAYKDWLPDHFYTFWEPGMEGRTDLPRRDRIRLMSNMYQHHPYFKAMGSHRAIYDVISLLYKDGVRIFSDTVFIKPARHGIEASLHQDTAFWPRLEPNAINCWLAIDRATVGNGCLHIIPQSHTVDLPHHDHPVQGHILAEDQVDMGREIPIEIDPGDAIFFDSGLVHRSHPNCSDHHRRAYSAVYCAAGLRHVEPWKTSSLVEKTPDYEFELIDPV